jgi:hypothetical protein
MRILRALLLVVLCPISVFGWTTASDEKIASKSEQLAPADVKMLIEKYHSEYLNGLKTASSEEKTDSHEFMVLTRKGNLRAELTKEVDAAIKLARSGTSMADFVEALGRITHLVSDANTPFHVSNADLRLDNHHLDYEAYFERNLAKFPTVFYGLDSNLSLDRYLDAMFTRSAKFYPLLGEEYFRGGESHDSTDFDDRSTAFGVAAVSYSHAVTDVVNLYYFIWKQAGGDVRGAAVLQKGNLLLNADISR